MNGMNIFDEASTLKKGIYPGMNPKASQKSIKSTIRYPPREKKEPQYPNNTKF